MVPKGKTRRQPASHHKARQPRRPHYIPEWAESCGFENQAALAKALGADKSIVSKWYGGSSPGEDWQEKLAALFGHPGEPECIFQSPDEYWWRQHTKYLSAEEIARMKNMIEAGFPPPKKGAT